MNANYQFGEKPRPAWGLVQFDVCCSLKCECKFDVSSRTSVFGAVRDLGFAVPGTGRRVDKTWIHRFRSGMTNYYGHKPHYLCKKKAACLRRPD